ncbi:hypothetical protein WJX84_000343 [Apatococcus fuscideae]|uniref:Molybdenum cofactor biosynthesis protein MoaE n=1 Tax=Apatococcus fuscideae TaxID=2026836 RepID=A0AAW1TAN3_9CHLO
MARVLVELEYEAYEPMARKELQELVERARSKWNLKHVAIAHRIGIVPILEPSVIIAVSSAHRKDSLEACAWAIDELKAAVPIWKKELYEGGEIWKENAENRDQVKA